MPYDIPVQALTTCEVAADGRHVRLNFQDTHGRQASLTLPTDCAQQLIMTVPRLISRALRVEHSDASVRAVFALGGWKVELAASANYILTLRTPDGFDVSFALSQGDLAEMTSGLREVCSTEQPEPALLLS